MKYLDKEIQRRRGNGDIKLHPMDDLWCGNLPRTRGVLNRGSESMPGKNKNIIWARSGRVDYLVDITGAYSTRLGGAY